MSVVNLNSLTSTDVETLVIPAVWQRGRAYQQQGNVMSTFRLGGFLSGKVLGEHGVYRVRLWIETDVLRGECDCPYPGFCKHLVALALAWLEQRERFDDLQPQLDKLLRQPELQREVLRRLVVKDPVNFGEVLAELSGKKVESNGRRDLINLMRSVFERPLLTEPDAELLWERLQQVRYGLMARLPEGGPELPGLLIDLLNGALLAYRQTGNELLRAYLTELLELFRKLPQYYQTAELVRLWQTLCGFYFNPEYWELAGEIRRSLVAFLTKDPSGFGEHLQAHLLKPLPLLGQVAWYELLVALPPEVKPVFHAEYRQVLGSLLAEPEGHLWLADRLLESDQEAARKLVVAGLKRAGENEQSLWRERLIRLHQLNEEWQQAAKLCMVQFKAMPTFEEYLRLKDYWQKVQPEEQISWLQEIRRLVTGRGDRELWLRIVIDQQDGEKIIGCLAELVANPVLLDCLAAILKQQLLPVLAPVYPGVIGALLDRDNVKEWQLAWQITANYKKLCYQHQLRSEWEKYRVQFLESLDGARLKSWRKFGGAMLSS